MSFDIRFVDSISATATVRLNLNSAPWVTRPGTRFDPPPMRYAVASTLLTDGERIPAAAYGDRTLVLRLRLLNVTEDEAAEQLQLLFRELNRPSNFLRYRPGTSNPVWFRTKRCSADAVDFDPVQKTVAVDVPAEPFAYGLRETLAPVVVSNNPAAVSNGMFFDVTGVKGDVETPLVLRIARTLHWDNTLTSACGVRCCGNPAAMPFVLQCESMTSADATMTSPGSDPLMSGAGSNYKRFTATNALMAMRLIIDPFPAVASVDARGTYRVFLRHRQSNTDPFKVRLGYGASEHVPTYFNDIVSLPTNTTMRWTSLGLVPFPAGPDPVHDGSGVEFPVRGLSIGIDIQRVSGTGTLDLDCLLFVPADDRSQFIRVGWALENNAEYLVMDGVADAVYALEGTTEVRTPQGVISPDGGLPMVSPGATNRIVWMLNVDRTFSPIDALTDVTTITPSYFPRYLFVRPVGS